MFEDLSEKLEATFARLRGFAENTAAAKAGKRCFEFFAKVFEHSL